MPVRWPCTISFPLLIFFLHGAFLFVGVPVLFFLKLLDFPLCLVRVDKNYFRKGLPFDFWKEALERLRCDHLKQINKLLFISTPKVKSWGQSFLIEDVIGVHLPTRTEKEEW